MILSLPYPPTGNHYKRLRVIGGRPSWYLTATAKAFYAEVALKVRTSREKRPTGELRVHITIQPPDRRKRDLDNVIKCTLDALQKAGAIRDDADIVYLVAKKLPPMKGGGMVVDITGEA